MTITERSAPSRRFLAVSGAVAVAAVFMVGLAVSYQAGASPSRAAAANAHHHTERNYDANPRPRRPNPFRYLPELGSFRLTSTEITSGRPLPEPQWSTRSKLPAAKNISPQLAWSHTPASAQSYAITMYDPEAPIEGGAIQWAVANIPGSRHSIRSNAGASSALLPHGASEIPTAAGPGGYDGANPAPHTGIHDYYFTVWALDVPKISLTGTGAAADLNFGLYEHAVARATIVCPTSAA